MRTFRSLRAQLDIIFLGFLLLVSGSVTATYFAMQAQADDARIINLAGRQRMLTQKMAWLALTQPDSPDLAASIQLFDQTLSALQNGGMTLDAMGRATVLPPAPNSAIRTHLDRVAQTWAAFRTHLRPVNVPVLQTEAPLILAQLDSLVGEFETRAQVKLAHLQRIQLVFLVTSLLLLACGYVITRQRIVHSLATLRTVARRMARGHLSHPLPPMRDDELGDLGKAFAVMQAELAAARDQLESRVAQRTRELASALEFSQEIVTQFDLDRLLCSVTDRARTLMRAQEASLCLLTSDGEYLEVAASIREIASQPSLRQSIRDGLAAQVVGVGQTVVTEAACAGCRFLRECTPGHCAAVPLRVGERLLGALCTIRSNGTTFDPDEIRALALLANSAAIAIANARLAEARQRQVEQTAALAERERLAADLHDHLAQTLSFLSLKIDQVEALTAADQTGDAAVALKRMKQAVGTAYTQVRASLVDLREPPTAVEDFAQKLAVCVDDFREDAGCSAELIVADPTALALPRAIQAQSLHIIREALTNVRRHAGARRVWVRVERAGDEALLSVEDDGAGFDPLSVDGGNHLGLTIMRARAERSGGRVTISSTPGAGTKVVACFPLAKPSPVPHEEMIL